MWSLQIDELIKEIRSRGKIPILVGGTCYYAFNFLVRRKQLAREDDSVRRSSLDFLERQKQKYDEARNSKNERNLGELLEQLDPKAYALTKHNPKKFITYLESYFSTGLTIEEVNKLYKGRVEFCLNVTEILCTNQFFISRQSEFPKIRRPYALSVRLSKFRRF